MPKPELPPRGVWAPSGLLYDTTLTPAVRDTALQLRGLAWGKDESGRMSVADISQLLGKSQATLYGHMRLLRDRGALRWRSAGTSEIIVTFEPSYWDSRNLEKPVNDPPESISLSSTNIGSNLSEEITSSKGVNTAFQETVKLETPVKKAKKSSAWYYEMAQVLAEVCVMDYGPNSGRLFAEAKQLEKSTPEPTPELLREHYNGRADCYWRRHDWRGKKGQDPSPWAIRQTWGKWLHIPSEPVLEPAGWAALREVQQMREEAARGDKSGN